MYVPGCRTLVGGGLPSRENFTGGGISTIKGGFHRGRGASVEGIAPAVPSGLTVLQLVVDKRPCLLKSKHLVQEIADPLGFPTPASVVCFVVDWGDKQ